MNAEAKEARKLYNREWRRKNKDKVRLYNERYWQKRAKGESSNGKSGVHG